MNRKTKAIMLYAILMTAILLVGSAPGTAQDPLVSLSRLNQEINALRDYFNGRINALSNQQTGTMPTPTISPSDILFLQETIREALREELLHEISQELPLFVVVELNAGETIIGEMGTKMILRGGSAVVYSRVENGLADLTTGLELFGGEYIPTNHYLLISRDDGRGMTAVDDVAWVIVEGRFSRH